MKKFVLDCSIAMAWCFEDQADDYANHVLESLQDATAIVPELWLYEVTNVLLVAERRGKITPADSSRFLELLYQLPISIIDEKGDKRAESLIALARACSLSSYDATYLAMAMGQGLPLASRDKNLRQACKKNGVKLYQPKLISK